MSKKITLATLKSLIRKNPGKVYIKEKSTFDGMVDCVMPCSDQSWSLLERDPSGNCTESTLGYRGVWVVGGSRNSFTPYSKDGYEGIEVWNCCGSFVLATRA